MTQRLPRLCSGRAPHSMLTSAHLIAASGHIRRWPPTQKAAPSAAEHSRPATVLLAGSRE